MAGSISDAHENESIEPSSQRESFIVPQLPMDWVVHVSSNLSFAKVSDVVVMMRNMLTYGLRLTPSRLARTEPEADCPASASGAIVRATTDLNRVLCRNKEVNNKCVICTGFCYDVASLAINLSFATHSRSLH